MRLDTATQAHLRSATSGLSIYDDRYSRHTKNNAKMIIVKGHCIKFNRTFCKIGRMASVFLEEADADSSPWSRCVSGTRIGLCLRC